MYLYTQIALFTNFTQAAWKMFFPWLNQKKKKLHIYFQTRFKYLFANFFIASESFILYFWGLAN